MESALAEFGTTIVLGGFFILSLAVIFAILYLSNLLPVFFYTSRFNVKSYITFGTIPILVLCYVFGMLLEDWSSPVLSEFNKNIFPSDREIRHDVFYKDDKYDLGSFADRYVDKTSNTKIINKPTNSSQSETSIKINQKTNNYKKKIPDDDACKEVALQLFFNSKNPVYRNNNYFKELSQIQERIFFSRSFCLSIFISTCTITLVTIGVLAYRIKRQLPTRSSSLKFITYSIIFICFYVCLFYVGGKAFENEEWAFANRVFGYYLSLPENEQNATEDLLLSDLLCQCALKHRYSDAIKDAKNAEPNEINRNLIAIVPSNEYLKWKPDRNGEKRVLVVTWTNWDGYDDKEGQFMLTTKKIWTTIVPELKDFCEFNMIDKSNITLRLEQLLGLSPNSGKTRFVEMWVYPRDLFRPSPDTGITDHKAILDLPPTPYKYEILGNEYNEYLEWFEMNYKNWFNDLKNKSYEKNGFPWTRLGYTFDWGRDLNNDIGLSEFIIKERSTIEIKLIRKTINYCK